MKTNSFKMLLLVGLLCMASTFSAHAQTWTPKADMPTGRFFLASASVGGKIYVFGGATRQGATLSTVEAYDPTSDTWASLADMPRRRTNLSTAVVDDKIYVFGGTAGGGGQGFSTAVDVYDPAGDTWTTLEAELPEPRAGMCTGAVDGKIYAFGGHSGNFIGLTSTFMYDPLSDIWSTKAEMNQGRLNYSAAVVGGRIYAIGGAITKVRLPSSSSTTQPVILGPL